MAELLRIKARILAAMPQHGRESAMNCLTEALAVAKAQSALALELRSTIDLARLLAEAGQRDQARHDLALVYDRFTEGFETADLKIARQLLAGLGVASFPIGLRGVLTTWPSFSLFCKTQRA